MLTGDHRGHLCLWGSLQARVDQSKRKREPGQQDESFCEWRGFTASRHVGWADTHLGGEIVGLAEGEPQALLLLLSFNTIPVMPVASIINFSSYHNAAANVVRE